jgi:hypothetical protein
VYEVIGKCSICGGDVEGFVGPWYGTTPPRAHCRSCGAVEARNTTVIPMVPASSAGDQGKKYVESYYRKDLDELVLESKNLSESFRDMMKEFSDSFKWIKK